MGKIILDQIKGLSDSKWSGAPGSVYRAVGLDIISEPGLTKVRQKLSKDSGATVTELCKVAVNTSNGFSFWFSSTSGKIWARASDGTWTLAHTTTPAAGNAGCLGAMEYNGRIYWATESRLHYITVANADGDWSGAAQEDFATFEVTDDLFHPMAIQDLTLFIGDGNQVAQVDSDHVFDGNVLDIQSPHRIKAMIDYEFDILLGTYVADTSTKAQIVRWDVVSPSWNTSDTIEEVGINAFIRDDNYLYVNAGLAGNMYFYNGETLERFIKIPGVYNKTAYGLVHPNAVGNLQGVPLVGFSNGSGNPALQGIYAMGSYSRNYAKTIDLSFPISQNVTSGVDVGAIVVAGFDMLVAWKEGSNFGVDIIDYSNKYDGAYLETRMLDEENRNGLRTLSEVQALYDSLPAGTSFTLSYDKNESGFQSMANETVVDSIKKSVRSELNLDDIAQLRLKVAFNTSNNDAPTMEALDVTMQ